MADNVAITAGSGTSIAADEISAVKYQRIKLIHGADGVNDGDVSTANPLPVVQTGTPALPTGAATSAAQTDKSQFTKITDGTDTALVTASGEVNVLESNSAAIKTAIELIDNAVSGAGFNITQIGGAAAPIGAGTEATAIRVTLPTNGTGIVGLAAGTNGIGKLTANSGVDIGDVDILSIAAGDNNIGNVDIVSGTITTVSTLTGGGVAHDGVDSGNPLKVGAKAISASPTNVAAADRTDLLATLDGKLLMQPYSISENYLYGLITTSMTGTTSTAVTGMGAQGAGVRNYITDVTITNAHATVGTDVILQDGNGGATLWTFPSAAVYGGATHHFSTPLRTTANTALYAANVTTGASTKVSCAGYKAY